MRLVKPKKFLGQHFLKDLKVAQDIADTVDACPDLPVLEVGPGMGVLTQYLLRNEKLKLKVVEIDHESVEYLHSNFNMQEGAIIENDFLRMDLAEIFGGENFTVIGNFPYNISSQIFFKILDYKDMIPEVVCMLQREVARRLASPPGNKDYGILSVFLQAYYDIEYLFTVDEGVFNPPPKVKSGVIRVKRNAVQSLGCDEALFRTVVKSTFNQRRKTIWNSIRTIVFNHDAVKEHPYMKKRPEQLSVQDFVELTNMVAANK